MWIETVEAQRDGGPSHVSRLTSHDTFSTGRPDDETVEAPTSDIGHRIIDVLETWRIEDEWWREPVSRRYFDVVLEGGGHVVLFEDLILGKWFVQQP